jgi:hypothetical protein
MNTFIILSFSLLASTAFASQASLNCQSSRGNQLTLNLTNTSNVEIATTLLVVNGTAVRPGKVSSISLDSGLVNMEVVTRDGEQRYAFRNMGSTKCLKTAKVKNKEQAYVIITTRSGFTDTLTCACDQN